MSVRYLQYFLPVSLTGLVLVIVRYNAVVIELNADFSTYSVCFAMTLLLLLSSSGIHFSVAHLRLWLHLLKLVVISSDV